MSSMCDKYVLLLVGPLSARCPSEREQDRYDVYKSVAIPSQSHGIPRACSALMAGQALVLSLLPPASVLRPDFIRSEQLSTFGWKSVEVGVYSQGSLPSEQSQSGTRIQPQERSCDLLSVTSVGVSHCLQSADCNGSLLQPSSSAPACHSAADWGLAHPRGRT